MSVNGGKAKWREAGDAAEGYTAQELEAEAFDLHLINERLKAFPRSSGSENVIKPISTERGPLKQSEACQF